MLRRHCAELGRPYDDILRTHFSHWVILARDERAVAAKVARYFPDGLDQFWGAYLVATTPDGAARLFQRFVDAGIQYFVVQTLDPTDEETVRLLAQEVAPHVRPTGATEPATSPRTLAPRTGATMDDVAAPGAARHVGDDVVTPMHPARGQGNR